MKNYGDLGSLEDHLYPSLVEYPLPLEGKMKLDVKGFDENMVLDMQTEPRCCQAIQTGDVSNFIPSR